MMKENLTITDLHVTNIEEFKTILLNTFDKRYLITSIYRSPKINDFIKAELLNPSSNTAYYTLLCSNEIVGSAEIKLFGKTAFLNMIGISSASKGNGLGSFFLNSLIARLREKGFIEFHLDVFRSNSTALKLYLKNGFDIIGEKKLCELEFDKNINGNLGDFKILNFPQTLAEFESYGLSIYMLKNNEEVRLEIGRINDDYIVRSKMTEVTAKVTGSLVKYLNGQRIYYFESTEANNGIKNIKLDTVLRLKKLL